MNTTELITSSQVSESPSFGDELAEFLPWVAAVVVLAPIALLSLVLWAPFLLLFVLVAAPVVVVGLVAVAIAILVMPYIGLRHLHERVVESRRSPKRDSATPKTFSPTGMVTIRSPLSGLPERVPVGGRQ